VSELFARNRRPIPFALTVLFAAFIIAIGGGHARAETLRIGGTGTSYMLMQHLGAAFAKTHRDINLEFPGSLGSNGGIKALRTGALGLATSSRTLKPEEAEAGLQLIPFARSPIAFVTSRPDRGTSLTSTDIVDIYGLRRSIWPDGKPIRIILRPQSESDTIFLTREFSKMDEALAVARRNTVLPVADTDQDNVALAEAMPDSFTAAALTTILSERRKLTTLRVNGVVASVDNLASGSYPYAKLLYFVMSSEPSQGARAFLKYVQSKEGRALLRQYGCLPIDQ
jgi:phosphate transport system substrate-binding protein